jgi:uncharacterized protein
VELCCVAPLEVAQQRIRRRLEAMADPSDATPLVAAAMASRFEAWPGSSPLDTTGEPNRPVRQALAAAGRLSSWA